MAICASPASPEDSKMGVGAGGAVGVVVVVVVADEVVVVMVLAGEMGCR